VPRAALICPKTGYTIALRILYIACQSAAANPQMLRDLDRD